MPTVSIIMSVYNEEKSVEEAIESIIAQKYKDWEFIIVHDCSSDSSLEILKRYKRLDNRIRIIENEQNLGLAASLNKAFKAAQGKYIARMDGDDISYKDRLNKQVDFMNNNTNVDVLGTGAELIDEDKNILSYINLPETHDKLAGNIHKICPFFHPSIMMRRSFLERSGGYDERLWKCQDYDLWARMCSQSTFHNLQEPLIRYQTKAYKRPMKTILYSLYVQIRCSRYNRKIFQGTFWALIVILKSLLVNAGLYKPKSITNNSSLN